MLHTLSRGDPGGDPESRPWLRCTCEPFSKHALCEHIEYCRTLTIPLMKDVAHSADIVGARSTRGRIRDPFATAKSKAAAKKEASG